jgi:hypothetical protein
MSRVLDRSGEPEDAPTSEAQRIADAKPADRSMSESRIFGPRRT